MEANKETHNIAEIDAAGEPVHPDILTILHTREEIAARIAEMGAELTAEYAPKAEAGEPVVLISVLRGAALFMGDLARELDFPLEMDYMVVSSYGNATTTSGEVRILKDVTSSIEGKHVIIAEDIIDSGLTLSYLLKLFHSRHPKSVSVVTFMVKDVPHKAEIPCRLVGFTCPPEFVVGYGLDYAERYRNLPYVGVLKREVYTK